MARNGGFHRFGPGLVVAAAFVGPGTVTTASVAGARFGYALLWALLFSVLATIVLQEMSARLGLVSRAGLGEALRSSFENRLLRWAALSLVVAAIALGNAAFETGNITGAAIALDLLTPVSRSVYAGLIGAAAALMLAIGAYRVIEKLLIGLVALMSLAFIATAVMVGPALGEVLGGMLVPKLPPGSLLTVVALIGTTVVPYNLFLHATAVQEKWPKDVPLNEALRQARVDSAGSIILGGLVTLAIVITAATCFALGTEIHSADAMAVQLEPLLGPAAKAFFAAGLFAAGLSSAITAPLAACYAVAGALGWRLDLRSRRVRAVWVAVIAVGTLFAVRVGHSPVAAIVFAQAANGVLLPLVAVFLLMMVNRRELLGKYANGAAANLLGTGVILVAAGLGGAQVFRAAGSIAAGFGWL